MSEFEKKVRKRLIDLDWTMTKLAEELGVSVSYVFDILKGARKATETKRKMCELLGIEGDDSETAVDG